MKSTKQIKKLIKNLDLDIDTERNTDEAILGELLKAQENSKKRPSTVDEPNIWRIIVGSRAGSLAAAFLIISSLVACFVLFNKVTDLRDELELARSYDIDAPVKENATINLYLTEHQEVVAQHASLRPATHQPIQMYLKQNDILYYEIFDKQPEYMRPGIIVRGPSSHQQQINSSDAPVISNGHILTLSEAQEVVNFNIVAPSRLHPGYKLDQIRKIEGRDSLHLLYTDGINTLSLFEQSLDAHLGLSHQEFREYAVYRNERQMGGTILAWRDETLSYVLIGNIELSQLMDMALTINSTK